MTSYSTFLRRLACGAAFLGIPAACSLSSAEPDLGAVQPVTDASQISLPLDSYQLSATQYLDLQRAAWQLTAECVARFGVEYTLPEAAVITSVPSFENISERRYGLLDLDLAANYGYNVPPEELPPADGTTFEWNPSELEQTLLNGVGKQPTADNPIDDAGELLPHNGCRGEATQKLDEIDVGAIDQGWAESLAAESYSLSRSDGRVQQAFADWSACMDDQGFSYTEPFEPNNADWPEPAGQQEIAVATADVGCKSLVNLAGIWIAAESFHQQQLIDENSEQLAEVQVLIENQVSNSAQVLIAGS